MDKPRGRPKGKFTQHRRLDKLRELLERHPRGLSLYDLAGALDVTVRSMRRYLKEIEREYDLESVPTRGGAALLWRLRPNEMPRKVELRRTQVYALLAARRVFEPLRGSALFDEIDHAVTKLLALAQRPGRGPNAGLADVRLEQRFMYLPHAPKNYAERTEELDDLFQAVSDLRPLSLLYKSPKRSDEERITIHPYALVLHRDSIYCVGFHLGHQEIRTLLLDRMRDTECAISERFELPEDFRIEDHFQGQFGIWRGRASRKVVIEFDARVNEYVETRRVHPSQSIERLADGGIRLTMEIGDLTEVTTWVLGFGETAKVVEPPELRDRVRAELQNALARYGEPAPPKRAAKKTKK